MKVFLEDSSGLKRVKKGILHLVNEEKEYFQHFLIGNGWSLEEMASKKGQMNLFFNEQIENHLTEEEIKELERVKKLRNEMINKFLQTLSDREKEMYKLINPLFNWKELTDMNSLIKDYNAKMEEEEDKKDKGKEYPFDIEKPSDNANEEELETKKELKEVFQELIKNNKNNNNKNKKIVSIDKYK